MKYIVLLFLSLCWACTSDSAGELAEIKRLMQEQQDAWNEGDMAGYMQAYWSSDSLLFIGRRGMHYGWQTTLDNYRQSYPDRAQMGELLFENKQMRLTDPHSAWVAGRWNLFRESDTLKGSYLLVWEKIDGAWKIIADHSGSDNS